MVTIDQAITVWYDDHDMWEKLQQNAMAQDFSWAKSAEVYKAIYDELVDGK